MAPKIKAINAYRPRIEQGNTDPLRPLGTSPKSDIEALDRNYSYICRIWGRCHVVTEGVRNVSDMYIHPCPVTRP